MQDKLRKVGQNRGKPRIWLEGNELIQNGIEHGQRYNVITGADWLSICVNPEGKRKIAGSPARPIVDMTGRTVEAAGFSAGDEFVLRKTAPHTLTLTRVGPAVK